MDSQISLFSNFFIKNGSHDTIYTFKNYFATVISAISFQFQQNKSYPNRPYNVVNPYQFMNYVRIRYKDFDHGLDPFDKLLPLNLLLAIIDFISLYFATAAIKYCSTVITLYKDLNIKDCLQLVFFKCVD